MAETLNRTRIDFLAERSKSSKMLGRSPKIERWRAPKEWIMALRKSLFSRSVELAKLGVKLAAKEIQSGDFQSRIDQARLLTQSLSQLKGAAMKAGQLISLEMADYFPPEAAEILGQLQNNATAANFETIRQTLLEELGEERLREFTFIDPTPKASASIAQIHKAHWRQQEVALKVQHLGVAESIDSDLAILQNLAGTFCKLTQRSMNLEPLFDELKDVLKQEVDFSKEATLLKTYRRQLITLTSEYGNYFSPTVVEELTTNKVITMSWEEGETLLPWLKTNPSSEQRQGLAHLVLNLYCHEFFDWGLVQTDPNFSNFLIRSPDQKDADHVGLVILDFGSTRHYERAMIHEYVDLLKAVEGGSPRVILQNAFQFGLLDPRESGETKQLFVDMMNLAIEPFNEEIFDFTSTDYSRRSQTVIKEFVRSLKYSPPPHRILFLHRKLGGIFSLLKRLEVKLNIKPYWELMVNKKGDLL